MGDKNDGLEELRLPLPSPETKKAVKSSDDAPVRGVIIIDIMGDDDSEDE